MTLALNDTPALSSANNTRGANAQSGASSLLGSFVIAARQRGVHLSVAQLIRDHQLPSGEVSVEQGRRKLVGDDCLIGGRADDPLLAA